MTGCAASKAKTEASRIAQSLLDQKRRSYIAAPLLRVRLLAPQSPRFRGPVVCNDQRGLEVSGFARSEEDGWCPPLRGVGHEKARVRAGFRLAPGDSRLVSPGVCLFVGLADVLAADLGVDLGGGDVGVTQQLLHLVDVHAPAQHVGREAVAQGVRGDAALDAGFAGVALEDEPEALAGQALAAAVDEEGAFIALTHQARASELDVLGDFLDRLLLQRYKALPVALAHELDRRVVAV